MRWQLNLLTWRDCIEILFFSLMFYSLTRWLKTDQEKNLLPYFYGFCLVGIGSYLCNLSTMTYCFFVFSPVVVMLFMLLHQETLQRNMIALKNIMAPAQPSHDWLETLMRSILKALNNNTGMLLVLEHTDALTDFLNVAFPLDCSINEGIFNLIVEKNLYDPQSMIWIRSDGSVRGINSTWKTSWHEQYTAEQNWMDDAIDHTNKTDAFLIHLNPKTHSVTVAVEGSVHKKLTMDQTAQLIKRHIKYPLQSSIKKGLEYGVTNKKERMAQRTT